MSMTSEGQKNDFILALCIAASAARGLGDGSGVLRSIVYSVARGCRDESFCHRDAQLL